MLLIDFIHVQLAAGRRLRDALMESGAVRFRPILLTAGAAMLGAWPITLDPVFSGLAWALIFGLVVSTAFTCCWSRWSTGCCMRSGRATVCPADALQRRRISERPRNPATN